MRLSRAIASVLSGALIASAALVGVTAPASAADGPSISAPAVPRTGGTISVSGAGFSTAGFGIYLGVRQNGTSTDSFTVWIDDTNALGEIPGLGATAPMNADGSFSVSVPVSAYADGVGYSIVTRKAHGGVDPTQSTNTPLGYEAAPATATATTLEVSPSGSSEAGVSITLTATVAPASTGSVMFSSSGTALGSVAVNAGTASYTVTDPAAGSYSFTAAFTPEQGTNVAASGSNAVAHTVNASVVVVPEAPLPTLTLSKSVGLDAAGETITVTGTGYNPDQPIYLTTCTDVPLSDVSFSFIAAGCTVGAKQITSTPTTPTQVKFTADGSFETTLLVAPKTGSTAVYTIANHTAMADRSQDAKAAVSFAEPVPVPSVSVSKTSGLDAAGETVTVTGTDFVANAPATNGTRAPLRGLFGGAYVQFGYYVDDVWTAARTADVTKWAVLEANVAAVGGANAGAIVLAADGSFSAPLTATKVADAPEGARFGVRTFAGSGSTYAAFSTFTEITFAEPATAPTVTVTPNANLDPNVENTLTVTGTNFVGAGAANGTYVLFGETSVWSGGTALPSEGWIVMEHVTAEAIVDGAFTKTLVVPAGTLGTSKSYQVATSAAHRLSATDRSLDTFTPVTVSDEAPIELAIFLSADSVQQGGTLDVRGTGFPAGELVTVTVNSDPITLGSGLVNGSGSFMVSGMIPLTFAAGIHTVIASVGEVRAESALTVTSAPVILVDETPAVATCVAQAVSGATIQWNVKESFRTYVEGPIAKGSYSIGWGSGSGAYSAETDRGRVGFGGSATFTGHGGLLDLAISNPRIQINSATSASLIVNVTSKGFNGTPDVSQSGVVFATLSLPAASETASRISWNGASATLTSAGAAAFAGFYEAGAALDPVSFTLPLGGQVPCDSTTTGDLAATGGEAPLDVMWLGVGMLVLGAGIYVMRRKTARV